jgi:hypothetical protein
VTKHGEGCIQRLSTVGVVVAHHGEGGSFVVKHGRVVAAKR